MAKEFVVDKQWDAGEVFLNRLSEKQFPVAVAFWAKQPDSDSWYLFIASDRVEFLGPRGAYGEVMREFPEESRPWFDIFSIKLIGADDPVAKAVAQVRDDSLVSGVAQVMTHHGGPLLGGMAVDDVWIYPAMAATKTASS